MPKPFGYQHLLYLLISITITISIVYFGKTKIKDPKTLRKVVQFLGIIQLILITFNRVSIYLANIDRSLLDLIPPSFCGMTSLVFGLALLLAKGDSWILQFAAFSALVGGTLSTIYPDFIGQSDSIFYSKTISGLMHHSMLVANFYFISITKYFRPTFKKWASVPIGLSAYMTLGIFFITALDFDDAMNIYKPILANSPFTWWFVGILLIIVYTFLLLIFDKRKLSDIWLKQ